MASRCLVAGVSRRPCPRTYSSYRPPRRGPELPPGGAGGPRACPGWKGSGRCEQPVVDMEAVFRAPEDLGGGDLRPAGLLAPPAGLGTVLAREAPSQYPGAHGRVQSWRCHREGLTSGKSPTSSLRGAGEKRKCSLRAWGGRSLAPLTGGSPSWTSLFSGTEPQSPASAATRWQCATHPARCWALTPSLSPFLPQEGSACVWLSCGCPLDARS